MRETDFNRLLETFRCIKVQATVHTKVSEVHHSVDVPKSSTKFISTGVAHYHFDVEEHYLGVECNGDGKFVSSLPF